MKSIREVPLAEWADKNKKAVVCGVDVQKERILIFPLEEDAKKYYDHHLRPQKKNE